ncbi:hypothetical protein SUDANB6_00796 [Streptomyces sp. enrichment culture]|uniref:hypothetical protein n=1 Tax=Streptomyces sp. enrichment culture TaxID=1795815 RepID=UPI003F564A97
MSRPRTAIVGAGSAGYRWARTRCRLSRYRAGTASPGPAGRTPRLPRRPPVAAGTREPRRITPSPSGTPPRVRPVPGGSGRTGPDGRAAYHAGPAGDDGVLRRDRPVLAAGSADGLLPVPGVAGHAHGFRGLPEAPYPRDRVTRRTEPAAAGDPRTRPRRTVRRSAEGDS